MFACVMSVWLCCSNPRLCTKTDEGDGDRSGGEMEGGFSGELVEEPYVDDASESADSQFEASRLQVRLRLCSLTMRSTACC
jgi:hypothetical protein